MTTLSMRDRRALLLGGLVVLIAMLLVYLWLPAMRRRSLLADQLVAERALLQRERTLLADSGLTSSSAPAAAGDSLGALVDARTFHGADDVMATSAMGAYLTDVASDHEVWVQRVSTRPATDAVAGLRALHADVRAETDLGGLLRWLAALEHGGPLVHIERLEVMPRADEAEDGTSPLVIVATIGGYASGHGDRRPMSAARSYASSSPSGDALAGSDSLVARAVAHDLFAPDRQAPRVAYRIAGRTSSPAVPGDGDDGRASPSPELSLPTVHGTAVDARGAGFAMAAIDGGPVLVVRTGDVLGSYTVLSIERARVVFRDAAGQRHTVDATVSPDGAAP